MSYEPRVGKALLGVGEASMGGMAGIIALYMVRKLREDTEIARLRSEVERLRRENALLRATLGVP